MTDRVDRAGDEAARTPADDAWGEPIWNRDGNAEIYPVMAAPGIVPAVSAFDVFRSRRMAVLAALGFASGLPMMLTGQTLRAWLTAAGASNQGISAFAAVGLAYTFKFAWAPILDRTRYRCWAGGAAGCSRSRSGSSRRSPPSRSSIR